MKKTMTTLLIAALAPVLCLAQEKPTQPTKAQEMSQRLLDSKTLDDVVALEKELAANLADFSTAELDPILYRLVLAYSRCAQRGQVVSGNWVYDVIPKYIPNWNESKSLSLSWYYNRWISVPSYQEMLVNMEKSKTPAELDAVLAGYFSKNLLPERIQADSRNYGSNNVHGIASAAVRVGHPEAINWALLNYKLTSMCTEKKLDPAVGTVAAALKAKDFNLTRANAWIEGQNTGSPAVSFTDAEKATPPVIPAELSGYFPLTMQAAKEKYRTASAQTQIDAAIYAVATALKAQDLNLARANAWIKSQKDGTPFELP